MIIKKVSDLEFVRFKLEHTYSCYVCGWVGIIRWERNTRRVSKAIIARCIVRSVLIGFLALNLSKCTMVVNKGELNE